MLLTVIIFALIPASAIFLGGIIATFRPPTERVQSFVQHFAAGVVFAALTGEVLPDLTGKHPQPVWVIIGFSVGVALMLGIRWFIENRIARGEASKEDPSTLILVVGIDVFVDGLLIGIGIGLGQVSGILLTVALAIEILFLGLATGAEMNDAKIPRKRVLPILLMMAAPSVVGVFIGGFLLSGVSETFMAVILSFAAAALLYLVTEELLVEAHEIPETPFATASFFVGFIVLYVLEMVL